MKRTFVTVAMIAVALMFGRAASAATILYSYEVVDAAGPDGFFGLGADVSQDTIGATHLQHSMKFTPGAGGFVGARTESVPAALNNPPGVSYILFDMFIPERYAGSFADIGVTVFGHEVDGGTFGIQNQFTDTVSIAALSAVPGQYTNLRIDLDSEFFSGESFNEIFGDDVSDLDIASAFQFLSARTPASR